MQENRALQHSRQRRDAGVIALEGQLRVNLVRHHQQVVLEDHVRNLLQLGARHRAASRVRREIQHEHLALRRDDFLDGFRCHSETILRLARHGHGHAVRERDARRVAHVARLVIDDFVTRIDDRAERDVHRLTHTDGDDDLVLRVVGDVEMLFEADGDGFAQLEQAKVRRVAGAAFFEREDGGLADVPRGDEIWLTHAERDDILHSLHDIEKIADARARDIAHVGGDESVRLKRLGHAA